MELTRDVKVVSVCLDGVAYGTGIAIVTGLEVERKAFVRVLAKLSYYEANRGEKNVSLFSVFVFSMW